MTDTKTKQQSTFRTQQTFHEIAEKVEHNVATVDETRTAVAAVNIINAPTINFNEIDVSTERDIVVDCGQVEPVPITPDNLPAIINKQLAIAGRIEIQWHMVKHLPGYLVKPIRALGRKVFEPFTSTPLEQIQVIATIGGGPNHQGELDAMAGYLSQHGQANYVAQLFFEQVIPQYSGEVVAYNANGYTFLLVKDFAGQYIYCWPAGDSRPQFVNRVTDGVE